MVLVENIKLIPSFYQEFQCLAENCADTCCCGFSIPLDKLSLDAFHAFSELYMQDAVNHLQNTGDKVWIKFQNGLCPFLHHNLCTIQSVGGEEYLSYICRMYPRTVVNYGHLLKNSLFLSCEAVATLILGLAHIDKEFECAARLDEAVVKQNSFFQKVSAELIYKHGTASDSAKKLTGKMDITDAALIDIIRKSQPGFSGLSGKEVHNLVAYYVWHYYNGNNECQVKDISLYMIALADICTAGCQSTADKAAVIHKLSKEIEHSDSNMKIIWGFYQKEKGEICNESKTFPI